VDSTLFTRNQFPLNSSAQLTDSMSQSVLRIKSGLITAVQSKVIQSGADLVTPMSLNTLDLDLILEEKFDVLHIHAFYNFLSIKGISKLAKKGKPIFITLHDQRLITGGCHYSRDCSQYQRSCKSCPQIRRVFNPLVSSTFNSQIKLLANHQNIGLISPSKWLAERCEESEIARKKEVQVVHNPVPTAFFENAVSHNVTDTRKHFGFSAADLNNPYKGVQVFAKAINKLNEISKEKISVLLIGGGQAPDFAPAIEIFRAEPKSDFEIIEHLKSLKSLVVPSNQDNSPSVVSEALAMGIPVVGSDVGGIPEILRDFQLPIFEAENYLQLATILNEPISSSITAEISNIALQKFSEKIIAEKLLRIYSSRN